MKNKINILVAIGIILSSCGNAQNVGATVSRNIPPANFQASMDTSRGFVLVDVRTPEEYESGHLKNAINIDFRGSDFEGEIAKLSKQAPVFVYCHSGNRSGQATRIMEKLGFTNVTNLSGGISQWESDGKPVVTGR